MPVLKTYDLFISHAWRYNESYYRLVNLLIAAPNFYFRNYSVPKHDPVLDPDDEGDRKKLLDELFGQVKPVNCVLIISGMYVNYSYWIQAEIEIAKYYSKPIVGIFSWAQVRTPKAVSDVANEMVGWSTNSIISAIRRHSL
jgi:hypothetical protein